LAIHWPDNTRNWDPEVRKIVREIERLYDVHCYTYPKHGRPGERWSIDIPVAPLGRRSNAKQKALGERIQKRAVLRWRGWGLDYIIWWNWMREAKDHPWFDYEPFAFKWPFGSNDPDTRRHMDHVHLSCIRGFTYRAPRSR
jgi:hypothetical protein